jgi:hypothetical protein
MYYKRVVNTLNQINFLISENGKIGATTRSPLSMPKTKDTENKPLADLMAALDPDNPRVHTGDIPSLAIRLLHYDWQKLPTYNKRNKLLAGGHGRVMACEYLVQQPKEWFEAQYDRYLNSHKNKLTEAEFTKAKIRFAPKYWLQIPVLVIDKSDRDHKIILMALNNADGQDDEAKVAKILARMDELNLEATGYSVGDRDRLLSQFKLSSVVDDDIELGDRVRNLVMKERDRVTKDDGDIEEVEFDESLVTYPLNVQLGKKQWEKYEALMARLKVKTDLTMLIKFHPAFNG